MTTLDGRFREYTLDNGLRVALQQTPTQTVAGRLRVFHGAVNEKDGEEGLAHFLEHTLVTGGSENYSPELSDNIRNSLGSFNAYTSHSETTFPAEMLAEDAEVYIDFIADTAFRSSFDDSRVNEERQRILREIADAKGNPSFRDTTTYRRAFYGDNSPLNRFVLGSEEVVASTTPGDLRTFHRRGYSPNNMDLILVGTLPDNIDELVDEHFGAEEPGSGQRFTFPSNTPLEDQSVFHTKAPEFYNDEHPEQSSASLWIAMYAPPENHDDSYAVNMMTSILGGGGTKSRLFNAVSMRRGLAYSIGASYDGEHNNGIIQVGGSVHAIRAEEAIDAIFGEFRRLQTEPVDAEDLDRLKKSTRFNIAKTYETNWGHAQAIQLKMDKGLTPEVHLERMDAVTPEKVQEVAQKYLPGDRETGRYVLMLRDPLK